MGIPTSVSQTTPETSVAGLRNHLTSDLVPNRSVTRVGIPIVSSVTHISCFLLIRLCLMSLFHLFLTGLNAMQHRSPISSLQPSNRFPGWPCPPWIPQFQAHPGFPCDPSCPWSTFPGNPSSNPRLPSDASSSQTSLAREVRETLGEFRKSLISYLKVILDRLYTLESRSGAPVEPSSPNQCQEEYDTLSMAPGSQEASFLTVEEEAVPTTSVSKKSVSSTLNRTGTPEEGSSSEFESEEFPASRDQLKARVYSFLREKAHVPFASPPRIQKTLSTFETSCGLSHELSSSYKSFPESKHVSTVLQVIQDSLASPAGSSSNNAGKFPGFGPSSFPGRFRSKDFEIHNSSIGKSAPTCDKTMASLLGSKSVDGLRLTQSLWSRGKLGLRVVVSSTTEQLSISNLWFWQQTILP